MLSNLGLSYALTKQLGPAEAALAEAAASPRADARMRQNYALVLGLEGKFGEAETVSRRDMSAEDAKNNMTAIRGMIAQNDSWRTLKPKSAAAPPKTPPEPRTAEVEN